MSTPTTTPAPQRAPMSPVHICLFGTNAATTMARPQIGQPSTGEQAAAQDALNLLRQHGFTITYDLPLPEPITPREKVLAWLDTHEGHHTSYDVARGSGVEFWLAEALLEQLFQVGRVGFLSGSGWFSPAPRLHCEKQPTPQGTPASVDLVDTVGA